MKLFYSLLLFVSAPVFLPAQCTVTISHTDNYCYGSSVGTAVASSTGVSPFTYLWSPGNQTTASINALATGTYTVTMTDANSCVATATVAITTSPPYTATITSTPPSCGNCCDGSASVNISGGTGPYTFQWLPSGPTTQSAYGLCAGTYSVCVIDQNGCSTCDPGNCSFCQTSVTLSPTTGIANPSAGSDLSVYPNPASQTVNIRQTFEKPVWAEITLTNVLGQKVRSESRSNAVNLDISLIISDLPDGIYFVTVKTTAGNTTKRIVKQ
jgi:hypothetical protein